MVCKGQFVGLDWNRIALYHWRQNRLGGKWCFLLGLSGFCVNDRFRNTNALRMRV